MRHIYITHMFGRITYTCPVLNTESGGTKFSLRSFYFVALLLHD